MKVLRPVLLGAAAGALASAAFFTLFSVLWALTGAPAQRVISFGAWGVVSGAVAGTVTGVCRAIDRWRTQPEAEPEHAGEVCEKARDLAKGVSWPEGQNGALPAVATRRSG